MLGLIIVLIVIGLLLFAVNSYLPLDPKIKTIINVVVVICTVLYVLSAFGLFAGTANIPIPRLR